MKGIYTIKNKITGQIYVGYSTDIEERLSNHKSCLLGGYHENSHLQNSFTKHGRENFEFEILEECKEEFLCSQEHYWCNLLDTHNRKNGYNILPTHPIKKAYRHSLETKDKISSSKKGINFSKKHRKNLSISNIGKISNRKGITVSEETRKKLSESHLGIKYPNKKKPSEETRRLWSSQRKGKMLSQETKDKISSAMKRFKNSQD